MVAVVSLLLSAFFNYYGNRPWILYFPLIGICGAIFYFGHLCIQSLSGASSPESFFSTTKEVELLSAHPEPMSSRWWLVYPMGDRQLKSPVTHLLKIGLTNQRQGPLMVSSYSIEARIKGGKWKKVTRLPDRLGTLFLIDQTMENASEIELDDSFEKEITGKKIDYHDTVRGWILLEVPKPLAGNSKLEWRLRVRDISNAEAVTELTIMPRGSYEDVNSGGGFMKKEFHDIREPEPVLYSKVHWR